MEDDERQPVTGPEEVDALVERLKRQVEERRSSGDYPPHLEADLDANFRRIVATQRLGGGDVQSALGALAEAADLLNADRIPTKSRIPGGTLLHRLIAKVVHRQMVGIVEQIREYSTAVQAALEAVSGGTGGTGGLTQQLDVLHSLVASQQQSLNAQRADLLAIIDRRLKQARPVNMHDVPFEPWYDNDRFEAAFRGSRKELLERYRDLASHFIDCGPVLDLGFGRGELLQLLDELGVEARGVEADPQLVRQVAELGFDVMQGDGADYLRGLPDASLGGLAMIQVIEHLSPGDAMQAVLLAARKVRPGGKVIVETVNPQSLYVFARSFYLDPTHVRPVHPSYLEFLFGEAGFAKVQIDWRNPPRRQETLEELDGDDDATRRMNSNIANLNALLFAPQDYAIVATR